MKWKFTLIRSLKFTFHRLHLYRVFGPFQGFFLTLGDMTRLSRFMHQHKHIPECDFPLGKFDYTKRYQLYEKVLANENLSGAVNYLEFGVAQGVSFKWWASHNQHPDSRFHGFDTFEGLPENWGPYKAGDMSTLGAFPEIEDSRASFHKGLFQDTLPAFLTSFDPTKRKIIHLDADLYSSTLYVLTRMAPYLNKGDILLFDEFSVPRHEFLAFTNFVEAYRIQYQVLVAYNNFFFTAMKLV